MTAMKTTTGTIWVRTIDGPVDRARVTHGDQLAWAGIVVLMLGLGLVNAKIKRIRRRSRETRIRQVVMTVAMLAGVAVSLFIALDGWEWHPPQPVQPSRHEGQRR